MSDMSGRDMNLPKRFPHRNLNRNSVCSWCRHSPQPRLFAADMLWTQAVSIWGGVINYKKNIPQLYPVLFFLSKREKVTCSLSASSPSIKRYSIIFLDEHTLPVAFGCTLTVRVSTSKHPMTINKKNKMNKRSDKKNNRDNSKQTHSQSKSVNSGHAYRL